ncbi:MAG: hypothetical protein IJI14_03970, partial [Anaerolineaceae bacterium]|nr:hypothetical protein [Anaerolineaceae bacterium]
VDGDHRLDAARKLGMDTIPAMVDETVKPNDDEVEAAVKNYLLNARRISLSFGESASLLKKIETTTQNPKDIKKVRERMGISARRLALLNAYNSLDDKSRSKLEDAGLSSNVEIVNAALQIRNEDDRSEYIQRAVSSKETDLTPGQIVEFLRNAARITLNFSLEVQSHFNSREIPLTIANAVDFVSFYDTEEDQLSAINRLTLLSQNEINRVSGDLYRLLTACPELKHLIFEPNFPTDPKYIDAIIAFRDVFPEDPEKRLAAIESLFEQDKLTPDYLSRAANNIEKSLAGYPEAIQDMFFEGKLPFADAVFSAIDILLEKKWDLPTNLDLIEKASAGKFMPEQFNTRLTKFTRELEETFAAVSVSSDGEKQQIKSIEDAVNKLGLSDEEKEVWDQVSGITPKKDDKKIKSAVKPVEPEPGFFEDESETSGDEDENPFLDEDPDGFYVREFETLADSMRRLNNTSIEPELEIFRKYANARPSCHEIFELAEKRCKECRGKRLYDFDMINFCADCPMAKLIGDIEDIEDK